MLSLSGCKCRRDVTGCNGIMPDAQCRSACNNGNERRNTVYMQIQELVCASLDRVDRIPGSRDGAIAQKSDRIVF